MATSSTTTEDGKPLKTDRRTDLDGGLDTRSSVVAVTPDKALALGNFRFTKEGALTKRKGGSQLCKVNPYAASSTDLPAPILIDGGAGTGPGAGTYTAKYSLGSVSDSSSEIGASPASNALVLAAGRILIMLIPTVNSGEGVGQAIEAYDDPANAGFLFAGTKFIVYLKKDADPTFTKQTDVTAAISNNGLTSTPPNGRTVNIISYSNNLTAAPTDQTVPVPIRGLFWHPLIDATLGFLGERAFALQGAHTSPQFLARATDKNNSLYAFSRLPSRISAGAIDNVMIASDGVGKPKRLSTPLNTGLSAAFALSAPTSWKWRVIGANAPAAAPTAANNGAGVLNGTYQYVVTFTYEIQAQDGSKILSESNASAAVTHAPANNTVRVTRPACNEDPGLTNAGSVIAWNLYRTVAGGSIFFLVDNEVIATTTIDDNATDNAIGNQRPPGKDGKIPNDPPPAGLHLVTQHASRVFGVAASAVAGLASDGVHNTGQIIRVRPSNDVRYCKVRVPPNPANVSALIAASGVKLARLPDVSNFDAWSATFLKLRAGGASSITAMKSFRGVLYCFKEDEIGVIEGEFDQEFRYRTIWSGTGAMENSIIECGNFLLAFDQALGPIAVTGYNVEDLGYYSIQQDWLQPVTTVAGEATEGGGRTTTAVVSAAWDPVKAEARWVISNFDTDPTSAYATGSTPTFFEYVAMLPQGKPNGAFTRFTGARSGTTVDRRILSQSVAIIGVAATPYRARDAIYGDYHGRVVRDDMLGTDLDGVSATAISIRAEFPFFWGDNPEMVKLFRYVYALFTMGSGATDSLVIQVASLAKGEASPVTIATFNGAAALAALDQMKRIGVPGSIDGTNSKDRGMKIIISGTASTDPLTINELAVKYQDQSETRSKP